MRAGVKYTLRDKVTGEVVFQGFTAAVVEAGYFRTRSTLQVAEHNTACGYLDKTPFIVEAELTEWVQPKHEKPCTLCGKTIVVNSHTKYCPECAKEMKAIRTAIAHGEKRKGTPHSWGVERCPRRSADWVDPVTLKQREVDTYNAAHGTHWSYGQYVGGRR